MLRELEWIQELQPQVQVSRKNLRVGVRAPNFKFSNAQSPRCHNCLERSRGGGEYDGVISVRTLGLDENGGWQARGGAGTLGGRMA